MNATTFPKSASFYILATKLPLHYPGYLLSRRLQYLEFLSQHALGRLLHLLTPFAASMGYGFMLHGPQDCTIA